MFDLKNVYHILDLNRNRIKRRALELGKYPKTRGRMKLTWIKLIVENVKDAKLPPETIQNRQTWRCHTGKSTQIKQNEANYS